MRISIGVLSLLFLQTLSSCSMVDEARPRRRRIPGLQQPLESMSLREFIYVNLREFQYVNLSVTLTVWPAIVMGLANFRSHALYLCFDPGCVQHKWSGLAFKFLKTSCPTACALIEQVGVVGAVDVGDILMSDVCSWITSTTAEDPVDGMGEESKGQYAPLTDTGCC